MENFSKPNQVEQFNADSMSSPTFQQTVYPNQLSTPKANRSLLDSKSPLGNLRLKKSKRRECTPAYSPKRSEEEKKFSLTEKKPKEPHQQRLNFEEIEVNKNAGSIILQEKSQEITKKRFLSLIEESVNEVSDSYYGLLGSQTTPDIIFNSIFSEEKKVSIVPSRIAQLLPMIEASLREVNMKNFEFLVYMKTQIFYFDNSLIYFQVPLTDFLPNFLEIKSDLNSSSFPEGVLLFVPGSILLSSGQVHNLRLIFEVISLSQIRLAVIEIHPI
jgi:hypothetical protein